MKNTVLLIGMVLALAAFAGMMRIKTDVQTMDRTRLQLVNERGNLRETKRVLEAEWALLASPERLEKLVRERGYVSAAPTYVVPMVASDTTLPGVSATVVAPKAVSLSAVIAVGLSATVVSRSLDISATEQ